MMVENAVSVQNLIVQFGAFYAVNNISFSVKKGEIFGFLGANGAGKTTTIRVLCGLLLPTSGHIEIEGESFSQKGEALKEKVGYMSQKFTLYEDLTVRENLTFTARLRKISAKVMKERSKELLTFVGFDKDMDTIVRLLPGGIRQKVSLVASMLHEPAIIFLDEPTAGVTPASRAKFWELIKNLAANGKTVFVTTHYMDEAEQCDRIALMRSGEIIALDNPSALKAKYFPSDLIDLLPQKEISPEEITRYRESGLFSLLEPYGMRFHAEIKDLNRWEKEKKELEKIFLINKISPSLEDVFIRAVEGGAR